MRVVVLEDDHLQAEDLLAALKKEFGDSLQVELETTEHSFYTKITGWAKNPPSLFILDVMVRWTDPVPPPAVMPPMPPNVAAEKFYRAGLRCLNLLRSDPRLANVPVILFTILNGKDLEKDVGSGFSAANLLHIRKDASFANVLDAIRKLLSGAQPPRR